jgi:hypothetical protein
LSYNPGYMTTLKQYITSLVHIQLYTESSSVAVPMSIRKPRFVYRDVFFRVNTRVYVVYTPYTTPPAIFSDFPPSATGSKWGVFHTTCSLVPRVRRIFQKFPEPPENVVERLF